MRCFLFDGFRGAIDSRRRRDSRQVDRPRVRLLACGKPRAPFEPAMARGFVHEHRCKARISVDCDAPDTSTSMQAEQNELITRVGPGTACGALLRSYWQPVALLDEFDPRLDAAHRRAPGQAGARARRGPRPLSRRRRPLRPARPALPAPWRRPGVRPLRGRRPALSVPRLEVRRRRRLPRDAGRAGRLDSCASACASAAIRCRRAPACCSRGSVPRDRRRLRLPAFDAFLAPASHSFAFKGLLALQLAAGVRGRHRPGASVVPAPLPARRVDGRRRGLRPPVPRRERRRRRRRALADDADHARVPSPRDPLRRRRRRPAAPDDAAGR